MLGDLQTFDTSSPSSHVLVMKVSGAEGLEESFKVLRQILQMIFHGNKRKMPFNCASIVLYVGTATLFKPPSRINSGNYVGLYLHLHIVTCFHVHSLIRCLQLNNKRQ